MKTGISKKQKATNIYFNEADDMIEVSTYNTALKNRLTDYAGKYPSECRLVDDDENGCLIFEIKKGRFGFKLTLRIVRNIEKLQAIWRRSTQKI